VLHAPGKLFLKPGARDATAPLARPIYPETILMRARRSAPGSPSSGTFPHFRQAPWREITVDQ
jgi:hypothetical protein